MGYAGAMLALTAVQGVSQISQGYVKKAEADYNATLMRGKADLIDYQSDVEQGQYQRFKGQHLSKSTAAIAGSGVGFNGSAMAVMLDAQTQISIDQSIAKFNKEQEKNYTLAQADAFKRQGKQAVASGYANGFSTLLQGASNYAMYNGMGNKTSFDLNSGAKFSNTAPYTKPNMNSFR